MEAYTDFAAVYDTFMDETPYEVWGTFVAGLIEKYGISKERVRQIESRALAKIKLFTMKQPKLLPQPQSDADDIF